MALFPSKIDILRHGRSLRRAVRGQVLVEYLLMTLMLLALFTGLYRLLQGQVKMLFAKAGIAILTAYY